MKIKLLLSIFCIYNSSGIEAILGPDNGFNFDIPQRITTIQLDGVQYYISRMNPYNPELNYFLAYQYCRSLGLQLVSFETKEKADLMMKYLKNAGYAKYDFWTSGNNLGTDMFLWMSTGLPFNSTFNYINNSSKDNVANAPRGTKPQVSHKSIDNGNINSCVALSSSNSIWKTMDCMLVKDFICEQTRCYHYDYSSTSVPASLRFRSPYIKHSSVDLITSAPARITIPTAISEALSYISDINDSIKESAKRNNLTESITASSFTNKFFSAKYNRIFKTPLPKITPKSNIGSVPDNLPNITSFYAKSLDNVSLNLGTHKIDSIVQSAPLLEEYIDENPTKLAETPTIGPYDSLIQDYQADEGESTLSQLLAGDNIADDDASTVIPIAESSYKYNIKVRNNGKVLDHSP